MVFDIDVSAVRIPEKNKNKNRKCHGVVTATFYINFVRKLLHRGWLYILAGLHNSLAGSNY